MAVDVMEALQLFDVLDPATEAALRDSIERFGVIQPIVVSAGPWREGTVIDGHHRRRLAHELDVACPVIRRTITTEGEAEEIARTLNEDRRHLLDIEQRRELVAHLRAEGHSLRAIASAVGVSHEQARQDAATVKDLTVPERVNGLDGKSRPATRPKSEPEWPVRRQEDDEPYHWPGDNAEPEPEQQRVPQAVPKPDLGDGLSHPARYSDHLLPVFAEVLKGYTLVLDPFAGTGRIHELQAEGFRTIGVEIEPEWANLHADTIVGSALDLPFGDCDFDAICTSPTYGNRLADSHNAYDPESRRSYTHDLGRKLHDDNSGAMQWGEKYRTFHNIAWAEAARVLRPGGRFVVNIKDHIRGGQLQLVSAFHVGSIVALGLHYNAELSRSVATPSLRAGTNAEARLDAELVLVFDVPLPSGWVHKGPFKP